MMMAIWSPIENKPGLQRCGYRGDEAKKFVARMPLLARKPAEIRCKMPGHFLPLFWPVHRSLKPG